MTRAVLFGDIHLESGQHLGHADAELGNTRLRDAYDIVVRKIAAEKCDVLVFLGDLARTPRPGPIAYSIAQTAFSRSKAKAVVLIGGNHDHAGEARTCVHVVASKREGTLVIDKPGLHTVEGIQIGALPWTVPAKLFDKAPHQPRRMSRLVAEKLVEVARGMGSRLDPGNPSLLIGHWLIAGEKLATGMDVMELREPVLSAPELEASGPWDALVFGHNHVPQKISERTYSCGAPMRGGFGEEEVETCYMDLTWASDPYTKKGERVAARFIPTHDRPLLTIEIDVPGYLAGTWQPPTDLDGAVVRLRGKCSEADAERLNADGRRLLRQLTTVVSEAGAEKVVGPQLTVERERRARSDLDADTDPKRALDRYLEANDVDEELRPLVRTHADRIMAS